MHAPHPRHVEPEKYGGVLTYDVGIPTRASHRGFAPCHAFFKYSNGGCSGIEPDFLFIYSAYNFSNRIFLRYLIPFQYNIFSPHCQPFSLKLRRFALPIIDAETQKKRHSVTLRDAFPEHPSGKTTPNDARRTFLRAFYQSRPFYCTDTAHLRFISFPYTGTAGGRNPRTATKCSGRYRSPRPAHR